MQQTDDTERFFNTREIAEFLSAQGFKTAPSTLNKWRCQGKGPPVEFYGRQPLYRGPASLSWARGRLSKSRRA